MVQQALHHSGEVNCSICVPISHFSDCIIYVVLASVVN
jgi:hypothetical protein